MRRAAVCLVLFALGLARAAEPAVYPDPERLERGIDLLYKRQYQAAQRLLEAVGEDYPDHPAAPFFQALVDFAVLYEGADLDAARESRFLKRLDATLARAGNLTGAPRVFWEGSALGFRARHHALQGSWWSAYQDGKKARDALERCLKLDPSLADAKLGLGVYHVYADLLPGVVKVFDWFLRIKGDRDRGLREIREAARDGDLSRREATFFLATIAIEFEARHADGLRHIRQLLAHYPGHAAFRALEARALMGLGEYDTATARLQVAYMDDLWKRPTHAMRQSAYDYGRILIRRGQEAAGRDLLMHHFKTADDPFTWFLPWARYYIGVAYDVLGKRAAARHWFERTLELNDRAGSEKRAKERLSRELNRAERALAHAQALARTRQGAPEALATLSRLASDSGLDSDDQLQARWIAGLAALRAGQGARAMDQFQAALNAGPDPATRGYCRLGRAAGALVAGDRDLARRLYDEILGESELRNFHGRAAAARRALDQPAQARGMPKAGRRLARSWAFLGMDLLMTPTVVIESGNLFGLSVPAPGQAGRFSAELPVPAGGLCYTLRIPGRGAWLDPENPRICNQHPGSIHSYLQGGELGVWGLSGRRRP